MNMSRSISADEDWSIISSSSDVESETASSHQKSDSEEFPHAAAIGESTGSINSATAKSVSSVSGAAIADPDATAESVNTLTGLPKARNEVVCVETPEVPEEKAEAASSVATPATDENVEPSDASWVEDNPSDAEAPSQDSPSVNAEEEPEPTVNGVSGEIQRLGELNSPTSPPALPTCSSCVLTRTLSLIDSKIRNASRSIFRLLFADSFQAAERRKRNQLLDFTLFQHARYSLFSTLHRNQDYLIYYAVALAVSICSVALFRPAPQIAKEPTLSEKINALWIELAYEERKAGRAPSFLFARGEEPPRQLRVAKVWDSAVKNGPSYWADSQEAAKRFLEQSGSWSKETWSRGSSWSKDAWTNLLNSQETQNLKSAFFDMKGRTEQFAQEQAIPFAKEAAAQGKVAADELAAVSKVAAVQLAKHAETLSQQLASQMQTQFESLKEITKREMPHMKQMLDETSRSLYKRYASLVEEVRRSCQ